MAICHAWRQQVEANLCDSSLQLEAALLLWRQRSALGPASCIVSCHACHGTVQLGASQFS